MRTSLITLFLLLFAGYNLQAKETPVTTATFAEEYASASDGDILLLDNGNYGSAIEMHDGKTITLKAAENASPVFSGTVGGTTANNGGGLIFDGIDINRGADYVISADFGDIKLLSFKNLTISNVGRCFVRTNNTGNTIDKIEFDNCIIKDCGTNGWNFIYPKHIVKAVSVKNSTLYNYTNGESFFCPNQADTENVFSFIFENNTVYKWGKDSNRALAKVEGKYSSNSTYVFRNNIITEPGVAGQSPKISHISAGTVTAENNLVVNYGTYTGGTQFINDLTLEGMGLQSLNFPDPNSGDFTIISTSPLATAGVGGTCIGDPRWIKSIGVVVNLTTSVFPEGAGTVSPVSAPYEKGDIANVTASYNYGYRFKEWQKNGQTMSTDNPYSFEITEDVQLTAVYNVLDTYTLTVNKDGDGANWGNIILNPEPVSGVYEKGEVVTVSIISNDITSFLYWEDQSNEQSRQILMDENKSITAMFDWVPFIVGWTFDPSEPRGNRPGDFYERTNNTGLMKFFNGDGTSTSWGGSTKTFGGVTYTSARRYTNYSDMANPRYFQAEFSASEYEGIEYKNIRIKSYVAADNECVHKIQKLQYATSESGPFIDLETVDLTPYYNAQWVELNATLPELTDEEKTKVYIRWVADTGSGLLGTPAANATEGFYLANVFVYADIDLINDPLPPTLLSTVPSTDSNTASANGSIVLSFDKRVKAGMNDGKIEFNGEILTPVFGNKTVSYPYKRLSYGTQYSFVIPAGVITSMSDIAYEGKTINFSTMPRPQPIAKVFDAVVAADGTGQYQTIQEAIDAAPDGRTTPWLIFVKNGSYKELVNIPATKSFIHLIGQDREKTIIHEKINVQGDPENDKEQSWYANSLAAWEYSKNNPNSHMYNKNDGTLVKVSGNDFYAENISFVNDWGVDAQNGPQALAMMSNGDKVTFYNSTFRSFQDTWKTTNNDAYRGFAKDCFIEGAVDYIYGTGDYYFETSTLYNVRGGSVIVAPNHKATAKWGYVFESCIVDGNEASNDGRTKLGRPWHDFPLTAYLNTTMKINIMPEGWTDMGGFPKVFSEYNSMDINGNPVDLSQRKTCYSGADSPGQTICIDAALTAEQAAKYTYSAVTEGSDNWNPRSKFEPVAKPQSVSIDNDNKLSWQTVSYAISYVIYNGDKVIGFTTGTEYQVDATGSTYFIQAVNEYGSLGEMSDAAVSSGTSIEDNEVKGKKPVIEKSGESIIVRNIEAGTIVSLYSVDGRFIGQKRSVTDSAFISHTSIKGIYLVKVDNITFKVVL